MTEIKVVKPAEQILTPDQQWEKQLREKVVIDQKEDEKRHKQFMKDEIYKLKKLLEEKQAKKRDQKKK